MSWLIHEITRRLLRPQNLNHSVEYQNIFSRKSPCHRHHHRVPRHHSRLFYSKLLYFRDPVAHRSWRILGFLICSWFLSFYVTWCYLNAPSINEFHETTQHDRSTTMTITITKVWERIWDEKWKGFVWNRFEALEGIEEDGKMGKCAWWKIEKERREDKRYLN